MSTNAALSNTGSIWRDTLHEFWNTKKSWIIWIIIPSAIDGITTMGIVLPPMREQVAAANALLAINFIVMLVVSWLYPLLYLRLRIGNNAPPPSFGNFFRWLWATIRACVVTILTLGIGGIFMFPSGPLAILGQEPVVRRSWRLTKGNWWRLVGCGFMLALTIVLPIIILGLIFSAVLGGVSFGVDSVAFKAAVLISMSFVNSAAMVASAILQCTAYRILLAEKKQKEAA